MAEINPPNWLQSASHPAQVDRLFTQSIVRTEGVAGPGELVCSLPSGMTLRVGPGHCFVTGDQVPDQGLYHCFNDDDVDLTVDTANGANPRRDLIVAEVKDDFHDGGGLNIWRLRIVKGTPGSSPALPATPNSALALFDLTIPAGATDLAASGVLADLRQRAYMEGQCPPGTVMPYAGSSLGPLAFIGWLPCAGQAVSRLTYSILFATIGTAFGVGDGSTTFNLPDLRGRVPVGLDNMNGTDAGRLDVTNTRGGTGGAQYHTLTTAQLPIHAHGAGSLTAAGNTGTESAQHGHPAAGATGLSIDNGGFQGVVGSIPTSVHFLNHGANVDHGNSTNVTYDQNNVVGTTGVEDTTHFHGFSVGVTGSTGNTGSDAAHNNMQPYQLMNYIIRF